jgi:hypothetical protein
VTRQGHTFCPLTQPQERLHDYNTKIVRMCTSAIAQGPRKRCKITTAQKTWAHVHFCHRNRKLCTITNNKECSHVHFCHRSGPQETLQVTIAQKTWTHMQFCHRNKKFCRVTTTTKSVCTCSPDIHSPPSLLSPFLPRLPFAPALCPPHTLPLK